MSCRGAGTELRVIGNARVGDTTVDRVSWARVWASIERRAERASKGVGLTELVTLDDMNPMFDPSSMVVFGRRGAGKTHTLLHLLAQVRKSGDVGVYIDMRQVSSNAGVYGDNSIAYGTRATNILVDVLGEVHEEIYNLAIVASDPELAANLHEIGPALDALSTAITEVRVTGETSRTGSISESDHKKSSSKVDLSMSAKPSARLSRTSTRERQVSVEHSETRTGTAEIYIHLGQLDSALRQLVATLKGRRIWLLIDEWSAGIPYDLQPVLADMLRRTFLPVPEVAVKIAAIEHRARFSMRRTGLEYVGIELGADTAETLNLDSRLAIATDPSPQIAFIRQLLTEHFRLASAELGVDGAHADPVTDSFGTHAFELLVYASEGNPRDAINLASKAARKATGEKVTAEDVLRAADDYFWSTKYKNIEGDSDLEALFAQLMNLSIERGMRTVLFDRADLRRPLMDKLYDARLIHLLNSSLRPVGKAKMYDVYAVDFGSYAELVLNRRMRWQNDGFANPRRFTMDAQESWADAVVRRTEG